MTKPWNRWIPGVLGKSQMKKLCDEGVLQNAILEGCDHSSIDLHLDDKAWELIDGSVKPTGPGYLHFLGQQSILRVLEPMNGEFQLEYRHTYLFRLKERLEIPSGVILHGQATARSSIGRMDVLARLIVDGEQGYEGFSPEKSGTRELFVEITPMTFPVKVQPGDTVNQLRFFYGEPEASEVKGAGLFLTALGSEDERLRVDLSPASFRSGDGAAFRARKTHDRPEGFISLRKEETKPDPQEYWTLERANDNKRLTIQADDFYILRSKERIHLPPGIAVYCRAIDETIGEMRIHYAGFVHPYFGWEREDEDRGAGTPLIFEVRGHGINVNLIDGEVMARLVFYRMSKDPSESGPVSYGGQELQLSSFFGDWN